MIKTIKEKFFNKQFLTFAFIGAFNTIGSLAIYMTLVYFNVKVGISSFLGDTITMFFSYFLNMHFTYHQKPNIKSFVTFPLSYLPGILVNMIITVLLVDLLHAPKMLAKAFSLPITIPLNYLTMSLIVKLTSKKD